MSVMSRDLTHLTGLTLTGVKYITLLDFCQGSKRPKNLRLTLDVRGKDAGTTQGSAAAATRNAARIFMALRLAFLGFLRISTSQSDIKLSQNSCGSNLRHVRVWKTANTFLPAKGGLFPQHVVSPSPRMSRYVFLVG